MGITRTTVTNIMCSCLLVLAIPAGIMLGEDISKPYEKKQRAIEAVESGYIVYLDGVEVSSSQIDLTLYSKFSIDEENKIVFIAR